MYVGLMEYLDGLEEKGLTREADNIWLAYSTYPNLRIYRDHLGIARLVASEVNQFVDTMDITHRSDNGTLMVMPFINSPTTGGRIYADPPAYAVGYANPNGFGQVPLQDWKEFLDDACIGPVVLEKVRRLFEGHVPVDYKEIPD